MDKIKELELRKQQKNDFEEELFKDMFPIEEELAYHKELLDEPPLPFSTLEPKIKRGDPWSLKTPCVIVPAGSVVPTGKDNSIVSTGSTKIIPAGSTILFLAVLCLLRVVSKVKTYGLDLEELDIKWQMAMLSVRINRFEKKAGRKMKFNNKDAARFDKKKVKCYKCSELGHFARECTGKQLDSKARYSSFKLKELDKTKELKALLSVDSMLNWSDHKGEDVENGVAQVYGMIAGAEKDAAGSATGNATGNATGDVVDDVSNAAAEFSLMGISSQAKLENINDKVQLEESKARFDKWKDSSKNLDKLIRSSMSSRSKFGLGFGETFRSDEVFDPPAPSIFDTTPEDVAEKSHVSNNYFETNSVSNDFVSCDNSDKSSDSKTTDFASCVSSVKSSSSKTNEPLASAPSSVDFKPVSKTADQQSNFTNADSSFSFKENVKPPRNLCNKSGINSRFIPAGRTILVL
ncbi:ribonuclease H-like domain-containing protein, partial [Tanacetum coccineum]